MATPAGERAAAAPLAQRYARCIAASRRVRWDIDHDVLRGRALHFEQKFMPDSLSRVADLPFLRPGEARLLSHIQGRTYANLVGHLEGVIVVKTLELTRHHWFGEPAPLEALVRFADEEIKHQELFRRLAQMAAAGMPPGYVFKPRPHDMAAFVLARSDWAILALTLEMELLTQSHYRASIEPDGGLSELWKDVFLYHWKEESQHTVLDELEWRRIDARLDAAGRDEAVGHLVELVWGVDGLLQAQARADAAYFIAATPREFTPAELDAIHDGVLRAYRWQYVVSGVQEPRFLEVLRSMATPAHMERIGRSLAPIVAHACR